MSQLVDHVDSILLLRKVRGRGGCYQVVCNGSEMYHSTRARQVHPMTTKNGTCAVALHDLPRWY
eukprot:12921251-Prorocentrum_lima.AAC.1